MKNYIERWKKLDRFDKFFVGLGLILLLVLMPVVLVFIVPALAMMKAAKFFDLD